MDGNGGGRFADAASLATAIALFIAALVVVVAVLGSAFGLFERKDYRGSGDQDVTFSVADGSSTGQIAQDLQALNSKPTAP